MEVVEEEGVKGCFDVSINSEEIRENRVKRSCGCCGVEGRVERGGEIGRFSFDFFFPRMKGENICEFIYFG